MKKKSRIKQIGTKIVVLVCASIMTIQLGSITLFAAPDIQKARYDEKGVVEVDFWNKVQYKNVKVTVKDSSGKSYKARIIERDNDELEFVIKNYKDNEKYTYQISGIRARGEKTYGNITGTVRIPKESAAISVKKVSCDIEDREVEFSLNKKVSWKKPSIKITDGKNTYTARITDIDDDDIEVFVKGLKRGKTYQYKITGAYAKGSTKALTLEGTFRS